MKKLLFISLISSSLVVISSCKKTEDPAKNYSSYGVFKNICPLKDSVTIDLKTGDSLSIETNKGIVWVKMQNVFVRCYRGIKDIDCPDFGIGTTFQLRFNNEIQKFHYSFDDYTRSNYQDRYPLLNCKTFLPIGVDSHLITVGKMNIQFRNIYPNPSSDAEHNNLKATSGYHVTLTFQKRCF